VISVETGINQLITESSYNPEWDERPFLHYSNGLIAENDLTYNPVTKEKNLLKKCDTLSDDAEAWTGKVYLQSLKGFYYFQRTPSCENLLNMCLYILDNDCEYSNQLISFSNQQKLSYSEMLNIWRSLSGKKYIISGKVSQIIENDITKSDPFTLTGQYDDLPLQIDIIEPNRIYPLSWSPDETMYLGFLANNENLQNNELTFVNISNNNVIRKIDISRPLQVGEKIFNAIPSSYYLLPPNGIAINWH
jgi:hypothetical protein